MSRMKSSLTAATAAMVSRGAFMKHPDSHFRGRPSPEAIADRLLLSGEASASKVPGVILVAAIVGVFPLAFALDRLIGGDWLGSALSAIAIAAILAINACLLIGA